MAMDTGLRQEISIESKKYPSLLSKMEDPPTSIYCEGDVSILQNKLISIVGTRAYTSFGDFETERLVDFCARYGLTTVSGLAKGVDAAVHKYSMARNVPTIAVLPSSLDNIYPIENIDLARDIVAHGGLLLSEHNKSIPTEKYTFLKRNRIIAGLSLVTAVIEAGAKSGALITANHAHKNDRHIFVALGLPINKKLEGNMFLLDHQKAHPLTFTYKALKETYDMQIELDFKIENSRLRDLPGVSDLGKEIIVQIVQGHREMSYLKKYLANTKYKIYLKDINVILAEMQLQGILKKDMFGNLEINM